ncbi:MAG: rhomboid family intramembrane serine protease [Micropruina sp.]|nr:MAG: rhomboid family intramembrane serine protease [Micropruina sp.]
MTNAAVGVQCPDCVRAGVRDTRSDQLPFGGRRIGNPGLTSFVLIGLNAAVWALLWFTGAGAEPWYDRLALLPRGRCVPVSDPGSYFPEVGRQACRAVGGVWQWVPGLLDGAPWQALTAAFTHVEPYHLATNMLSLFFIGPILEQGFGRVRFLVVYLLSALSSAVAVAWFSDPMSSTVGASGAIFGLLGALVVLARRVRGNLQLIGTVLLLNLAIPFFIPGVSMEGHLGGLVGGFALAALIVYAPRAGRTRWQWLGFAAFTVVCVGTIVVRALVP